MKPLTDTKVKKIISRRIFCHDMCLFFCLAYLPSFNSKAQEVEYAVLSLSTTNFPLRPIATCNDLTETAAYFDKELSLLQTNFLTVGSEVKKRVNSRRKEMKDALDASIAFAADSKIDQAFASLNLALGVVFVTLGCVLTAPVAIGVATGTSIISATATFGWQALYKKSSDTPSFVLSYTKDQTFMFAGLIGDTAGSTAGKLISNCISALTLIMSGYEIFSATKNESKAKAAIQEMTSSLKNIDIEIAKIGDNNAAWANYYKNHLKAAKQALTEYTNLTKNDNCQLLGPILRKP